MSPHLACSLLSTSLAHSRLRGNLRLFLARTAFPSLMAVLRVEVTQVFACSSINPGELRYPLSTPASLWRGWTGVPRARKGPQVTLLSVPMQCGGR